MRITRKSRSVRRTLAHGLRLTSQPSMRPALRAFALVASVTLVASLPGCLQSYNSTSRDQDIYGAGGAEGWATASLGARQVLINKCADCHYADQHHHAWTSYTEARFAEEGLIDKQSPSSSELLARITSSMPPTDAEALSSDERQTLEDWIRNYK